MLTSFRDMTPQLRSDIHPCLDLNLGPSAPQEAMPDSQDICFSCSALINQVDECEIKLMALENEVSQNH